MPNQTVTILLIEDDEIDAEQIVRSFEHERIGNPIIHVYDGIEALETLRGAGGRERLARPYIILVDINMPRMNGLEFLNAIRDDEELKQSVVFVLTTSDNERDKVAAYHKRIAGYFLKSRVAREVFALPQMVQYYWRLVEFPSIE